MTLLKSSHLNSKPAFPFLLWGSLKPPSSWDTKGPPPRNPGHHYWRNEVDTAHALSFRTEAPSKPNFVSKCSTHHHRHPSMPQPSCLLCCCCWHFVGKNLPLHLDSPCEDGVHVRLVHGYILRAWPTQPGQHRHLMPNLWVNDPSQNSHHTSRIMSSTSPLA